MRKASYDLPKYLKDEIGRISQNYAKTIFVDFENQIQDQLNIDYGLYIILNLEREKIEEFLFSIKDNIKFNSRVLITSDRKLNNNYENVGFHLIESFKAKQKLLDREISGQYISIFKSINNRESTSISIIIPARNEAGNIKNIISELPVLNQKQEVIFIEGHSTDDTWEEINRFRQNSKFEIRSFKQNGIGKYDAVKLGCDLATNELLIIFDADLSVPAETLKIFYEAYLNGKSDFIIGDRLTLKMERHAMPFLNKLGNIFFAKLLSYLTNIKIHDTLCGTKLISKENYLRSRIVSRKYEFDDPFGDFELIFAAKILNLGIISIPVNYKRRRYGKTNIKRFYHGWRLLILSLNFYKKYIKNNASQ